jgi:predicted dehydrogenase
MKTIKWGILGTGYIARKFAEGLKVVDNAELLAVASRNSNTAEAFAAEYNVPKAYDSYEQLAADPDVDVVYIATPHHLHKSNTLMSLDHGKHVLCEKPFAVNEAEVKQMIAKAEEKGLFLMEALWSRFLPNIIKAKELIDSGAIGEPKLLNVDFGINVPFDPAHRLYNKDLVGGSLLDLGIYPVFLSLFLLGKPEKVQSLAVLGATDVDYTCSMSFAYPNDLMSVMFSSSQAQTDVVATIYGTKGSISFDKWWFCPVNIWLTDNQGNKTLVPLAFKGNGYNYEAQEVVDCLLAGKTQSDKMSWANSLELIIMLDRIRKQCGISYSKHDNMKA